MRCVCHISLKKAGLYPSRSKMITKRQRYGSASSYEALPGRVFTVAWGPKAERVAAVSSMRSKGYARLYSAADGKVLWTREFSGGLYALAFHPGGERLAIGGFDGRVTSRSCRTTSPMA